MAPMQPKKYLQVFGCFFSLLSVVGIPFYLVTATRWETVFGVGGVIGYLLMQSFVFFVPLSFAVTMRRMIVKTLTRLPKTVASIVLVCAVGFLLGLVPVWASSGHTKVWRLLAFVARGGIQVGVLLQGVQSILDLRASRS